ncbi:MAG TPA: hypothetical protein VFZ80_01470 [Acidimicrobiia bacterium]
MESFDKGAQQHAAGQRFLLTRSDSLELGGNDSGIRRRVDGSRWRVVHPGVYQVDHRPPTWEDRLMASVLAAGVGALVSHRAALVLWGLDGISSAPVEITVPHSHGPVPDGTIVHRTRRPADGTVIRHIPVTSVERTLLDGCSLLKHVPVAKAVESALRMRLTSEERLWSHLKEHGGRGVKGTKQMRRVLRERQSDTATGSGSETEALLTLRSAGGIPEPELQHRFTALDGTPIVPDFFWPKKNKAVEIDGIDAHDSADKLDHDLLRQNKLMDLGVELRRFSARHVRRRPDEFVRSVRRFLEI